MAQLLQPETMQRVRRCFSRSSGSFADYSAVFRAVGEMLRERLDVLAIQPERILDLGCRDGYQLAALGRRYPGALVVGADPAGEQASKAGGLWSGKTWPGLRRKTAARLACDPHELPFGNESFDLVVSNLLLPWCYAPHRVFAEVHRVLAPGGAYFFTSAGPDTLIEYRQLWAAIDQYAHGFGFVDMHDIGDSLLAAGFSDPVLDRTMMTVDYPSVDALELELRSVGASNVAVGRRPGLMSGSAQQSLHRLASRQKRFVVSLELVQGHGWKGLSGPFRHNNDGEYSIPVSSIRGSRAGR